MSIQGIFADYRTLCGQSAVFLNAETGGRTQSAVFERLSWIILGVGNGVLGNNVKSKYHRFAYLYIMIAH
jgi:hypothetical protein